MTRRAMATKRETAVTGWPTWLRTRWRSKSDFIALTLLTVAYALWYVMQRAGSRVQVGSGDVFVAAAAVASLAAVFAAWRNSGAARHAWAVIAAGCAFSAVSIRVFVALLAKGEIAGRFVPLHAGWLGLVAALTFGIILLGRPASESGARRRLILDVTPVVIALAVTVWLSVFGSSTIVEGASWRLRSAAVAHGGGALVLLIAAIAAAHRPSRSGDRGALRRLAMSAAVLAGADLVWLQPWLGGNAEASIVAQLGFLTGFFGVGLAALRGSAQSVAAGAMSDEHRHETDSDWFIQAPHLSLLGLLLLGWAQLQFGDLEPHGVETAIVGSVLVVAFVMMRQTIEHHQARSLRGEIGNLTEQLDDPLTGLINRKAVHSRIEHELAHGRACGHPVAVALIDVDNFKAVNDTLGHQAGDRVLLAIGSILHAVCRGTDVAARYAGDEFLLLLPGLDEFRAAQVCERIVHDVRRIADELELGGIRVTLSVGAAVTHTCKRSPGQLIAIADAAMYDAKEGGKDRTIAVNADTLIPIGSAIAETQPALPDLTYLPPVAVRSFGDRRSPPPIHRAS
jgi:diguanylate cyclase (GGDEF)-like protein